VGGHLKERGIDLWGKKNYQFQIEIVGTYWYFHLFLLFA